MARKATDLAGEKCKDQCRHKQYDHNYYTKNKCFFFLWRDLPFLWLSLVQALTRFIKYVSTFPSSTLKSVLK
jgi:hypothetical protein